MVRARCAAVTYKLANHPNWTNHPNRDRFIRVIRTIRVIRASAVRGPLTQTFQPRADLIQLELDLHADRHEDYVSPLQRPFIRGEWT